MKEWLRWWSPLVADNPWIRAALAAAMGLVVLISLVRVARRFRER